MLHNFYFTATRIYIGLLCILSLTLAGCGGGTVIDSGAQDWPLFRGNASLSGYTENRLPSSPALLWTYKSDARTASSPVVSDGTAYWSDKRGHLRGVNTDGNKIFDFDFQTAVEATPMIHDSVIYIGRIDGFMCAVSLSRKDTLWTYETSGQISASPNSIDFAGKQAIVFGSYDSYMYCLNSSTGDEIIRFPSGYYINGAAALWQQHLIFGGCDSWLRIIDCKTGIATDSLLLENYVPASPAVIDNFCYVTDYAGNIYELQLDAGKILQHRKMMTSGDDNAVLSVPAVTEENIYCLSGMHLYAISRNDGSIRWKYLLKGDTGESSPVVCRDKVLVCTRTGIISILDADKGTLEWEYDTGEQTVASPAVLHNRFLILTARGTLFCFGQNRQ